MNDPWLDLCCFVLMLSASQAVLFSINAFITASNLSEVYGTWFKHYKRNHPKQFETKKSGE